MRARASSNWPAMKSIVAAFSCTSVSGTRSRRAKVLGVGVLGVAAERQRLRQLVARLAEPVVCCSALRYSTMASAYFFSATSDRRSRRIAACQPPCRRPRATRPARSLRAHGRRDRHAHAGFAGAYVVGAYPFNEASSCCASV
jgi:hypothetical protein